MRDIASGFVMFAIQEWGQSEAVRLDAVQALISAAGFDATATCWPVFGGIWPRPCVGVDAEAATAFLKHVTSTMKRGKYEHEVAHVETCIAERLR